MPLQRKTPLRQKTPMKRSAMRASRTKVTTKVDVREAVARRSRGWCEMCKLMKATNFHHRLMRSQGGQDTEENLLHLCGTGTTGCHGYVHSHVSWAYAHGALVKHGEDPGAVDFTP